MNPQLEDRFRATGADEGLFAAIRKMSPPVTAAAGVAWISPIDSSEMIWVEGGTFQMGSPPTEPGRDDDEPEHRQVVANGMWADVAEVTYESFSRFVMAVPAWQKGAPTPDLADSNYLLDWSGTTFPAGRDREPVRWVSWQAAHAYAAWAGKRLPTEAEWEYLARAGTRTRYWWGEEFDPARVRGDTGAVGDRRSRWGLQDVLGGVWEWTSSLYAAYPYDRARMEGETAGRRTIRGGAVNSGERFVRAANRSSEMPVLTSELIGFRCVR
jgi:serine/threonine-protein kinase PpkA